MSGASPHAAAIIELSLNAPVPVLTFGSFTLKSGRISPYFFNFGLFSSGAQLHTLSSAFADALLQAYPSIGSVGAPAGTPTILFGPAYKGIPLAATVATELARRGRDLGLAYNRKEKKDHGEGGQVVGADMKGQDVVLIDDVITKGTAIREAHAFVKAAGGKVVGIVSALDRQERGSGELSTVQEVEKDLGIKCVSVVKMEDVIAWLKSKGRQQEAKDMEEYREKYGIRSA